MNIANVIPERILGALRRLIIFPQEQGPSFTLVTGPSAEVNRKAERLLGRGGVARERLG
jgi:hypothetical protein